MTARTFDSASRPGTWRSWWRPTIFVYDTLATMLSWVYCADITLCLLVIRSARGALCLALPLGSVLACASMAVTEIGLKLSTLPVAAFGVGIGVDHGIYIFNQMRRALHRGASLVQAYRDAMATTGNAVLITGLTLAVGVSSWVFSSLQLQADMGRSLAFRFLANMLGAILLLPGSARVLYGRWTSPSCRRGWHGRVTARLPRRMGLSVGSVRLGDTSDCGGGENDRWQGAMRQSRQTTAVVGQ